MTVQESENRTSATDANRMLKAAHRRIWALGDYHAFAVATVWELGTVLADACAIGPRQRVLDVAAGTGNVAIRAAMTGATVVASDLVPEHFACGRLAAAAAGVDVEWVETDAEALPWGHQEFDVVVSCLGAIFAPDQQQVANEMLRVCRPGGTIGMINFTPEGRGGDFFRLLAPYAPPPPPGAVPPVMWGDEDHVRKLFGPRVASLEMQRREYVERAASPEAYLDLFKQTFGPIVAIYGSLADQPERMAELDRSFLEFVRSANQSTRKGSVEIAYEYLLIVAHKGESSPR